MRGLYFLATIFATTIFYLVKNLGLGPYTEGTPDSWQITDGMTTNNPVSVYKSVEGFLSDDKVTIAKTIKGEPLSIAEIMVYKEGKF